ncbi:hypothetical protein NLM27_25215 [Bradyrhizobium sp. CCGB12]|uniref:hypothetical protein n=1 Tax=Bradyrhizobium sp. CCGB12 TaxID=2949632 RepID=UPI0020B38353|nr:hypothetical protein [Bradyrhizobium sp. CCGB12]MCP3392092.1 hypothetical protein [Bradyrhizobium sp. CCGB12]
MLPDSHERFGDFDFTKTQPENRLGFEIGILSNIEMVAFFLNHVPAIGVPIGRVSMTAQGTSERMTVVWREPNGWLIRAIGTWCVEMS